MSESRTIETRGHSGTSVSELGKVQAGVSSDDVLLEEIEAALASLAPSEQVEPRRLTAAMRYSLLGPGKRVRVRMTALAVRDLTGHDAGPAMADAIVAADESLIRSLSSEDLSILLG